MHTGLPKPNTDSPPEHSEAQYAELSPFHWRINLRSPAWQPPTDVFETESHYIVRVEIAGMRESDFSVSLNDRLLLIRGVRGDMADQTERRAYHLMEIRFGEFTISLELPNPIDADGVQAAYNNGFLRVSLPKAHPHQIQIVE